MPNSTDTPAIYISYAWGSESEAIAEQIEKEFQRLGLPIHRDKNVLGYKGRIKAFMQQIGQAEYIILVISNKYLHSANCMFELIQIFKNEHFSERVFPVVLNEVNIYDASERVRLIKYWEDKTENLNDEIRKLKDFTNMQGVTDDLNLNAEIRANIEKITTILKDTNTLSIHRHISSDFHDLYEAVQKKIAADTSQKTTRQDTTVESIDNFDSGLSEKKKRFYKMVQGVVLTGVFFFMALAVYERMGDESQNGKKLEPTDSTAIMEKIEDSLRILETKNSPDTAISKGITEERKISTLSDVRYSVELVVPSNMAKAEVFVDGKPAEIVDRDLISITVRLRKKDGSHHFEIKDGDKSCKTDKLISKDRQKLILCD